MRLSNFSNSQLGRCFYILPQPDRLKIISIMLIQVIVGILDLIGVAALGVVGSLAVNGIRSQPPEKLVESIITVLSLNNFAFQTQVAILGSGAAAVLMARTLFSMYFNRKAQYFLSRRGAFISTSLFSRLLNQSLLFIQSRKSQETLFAITNGVSSILMGVIGSLVIVVSDLSSLVVLAIGLFLLDPVISFVMFVIFSLIGYALYLILHNRAHLLGELSTELNVESSQKILEVFDTYREAVIRNRRFYYAKTVSELRYKLATIQAELQFMPNISKYALEITIILGALVLSAVQFLLEDSTQAVTNLIIFLAAGTRIAPAILRIQQGAVAIKGNLGSATPTLVLIENLKDAEAILRAEECATTDHSGFFPEIVIKNASFSYPGSSQPAIRDVTLSIPPGSVTAIVGPSGAGKSTLVDLILGIITPDSGTVKISGMSPQIVFKSHPGSIAYVPQEITIIDGTIYENIALGFAQNEDSQALVTNALQISKLDTFVATLPLGIYSQVGESGNNLSGGQRQRLGIARALYTKPKMIVLDEATSALDGKLEEEISSTIQALRNDTTVVMIGHRLLAASTADLVVYLDDGRIVASGTFAHVRSQVPDFDKQASLAGL